MFIKDLISCAVVCSTSHLPLDHSDKSQLSNFIHAYSRIKDKAVSQSFHTFLFYFLAMDIDHVCIYRYANFHWNSISEREQPSPFHTPIPFF